MTTVNTVNQLTNEDWSSKKDQIYLTDANPYERKCYHNRYFLAWEKAVKPALINHIMKQAHSDTKTRFKVLDGATGSGAGAAYIAEQLGLGIFLNASYTDIVGVDLNKDAIDFARKAYCGYFNLVFDQTNILSAVSQTEWNVIVCMETLEHIPREVMLEFLQATARQLKEGGKAIFSCPRLRPRESTVRRPGHINELYYQEFKYVLGEYFPFLEFYSFDRYGNVVPDYPECNLQVAVVSKWNKTAIF